MRKLYLLFIIVFLHIAYTYARPQLYDTARVYIGTSHGIIGSGIIFNPTVNNQEFILGYNGGFVFSYEAQKGRSLQIELYFSQRGWKENQNTYAFTRRLNYIEIPILAQYYFGNNSGFILNLGPKIGFVVSDNILENTYQGAEDAKPNQLKPIKNKFDYGIAAGIGYRFNLQKQSFMIEARGNFSLGGLFGNASTDYFTNSNNASLSVNLGWMIRIK